MQTDHVRTISRSAFAFLSGTFLSRVSGMLRDVTMAFCFGSHPALAAFMVAFRFSNLLRRLFGEGQMPAGFIPYFETNRQAAPEKGALFFRDLIHSATIFLLFLIAVLEAVVFALWKWADLSASANELLFLTLIMLPGTLFICLFGLSASLLQCEEKFFLVGAAPIAFNVVWITAAFAVRKRLPEQAVIALSFSIVLGFALQWLMTVPSLLRYVKQNTSLKTFFKPRLFSREIQVLLKPILFGMIGVGAMQINSALDALFARAASLEGPAYLWYAIRMQQLPLALFGIALASALLPPLARSLDENNIEKYRELLLFALRRSFLWIFPCVVAIFVLGASSVNLLYGRGDFTEEATHQTVLCLWGYGVGLLPSVFVLLLSPAFYARKDFKTPMRASLYSVAVNIFLNSVMVFFLGWGAFSIALATSISAIFNCLWLFRKLDVGQIVAKPLLFFFGKVSLCCFFAGAVTLLVGHYLLADPTWRLLNALPASFVRTPIEQCLQFLTLTGCFALLLGSYTWMFKKTAITTDESETEA